MSYSKEYNVTKYACYLSSGGMAMVTILSPLLFSTFRSMYGISYTLLGLLIVANFLTQLSIDLIFSFFTKYFNIHKTVRMMPVFTFVGFLIYGVMPWIFPEHVYLWLIIGTVVFSLSAGLGEVLLNPVIAAIPSDNPERETSKLHSAYAWGCVAVVTVSTLFLHCAGAHNWQYLVLLLALIPLLDAILFAKAKLPEMKTGTEEQNKTKGNNIGILMLFVCIFLGGATEMAMSEWVSSFIESGIGLPKVLGDILGVALFAIMLGIGRTTYAKVGKNIFSVMLFGMIGATVCYIVAGLSFHPVISLVACVVTGLFVSMLWPGTLIYAEENYAGLSVAVYALMAAGGDLGASVVPQLVGVASDKIAVMQVAQNLAVKWSITAEQVGIRAGILMAAAFPLLGVILLLVMKNYFSKLKREKDC